MSSFQNISSPYKPITPTQFFPGQEPLYSDFNSNIRTMYRRAYGLTNTVENTIRKQYIGRSTDSYGRMNRINALNVGKYAYIHTVPNSDPFSTKSYDPSKVRSILKQVRNN